MKKVSSMLSELESELQITEEFLAPGHIDDDSILHCYNLASFRSLIVGGCVPSETCIFSDTTCRGNNGTHNLEKHANVDRNSIHGPHTSAANVIPHCQPKDKFRDEGSSSIMRKNKKNRAPNFYNEFNQISDRFVTYAVQQGQPLCPCSINFQNPKEDRSVKRKTGNSDCSDCIENFSLKTTIKIQRLNEDKLCLYKIGPGAVAFRAVVETLERNGMYYTPNTTWNLLWAKRVRNEEWAMCIYPRKINHFPGTRKISRKDGLHRVMQHMRMIHGDAYDFYPDTYLLPAEYSHLTAKEESLDSAWIMKPVASSCGKGIYITNTISRMAKTERKILAQRYIPKPLLINGHKVDLRVYVVVTSFVPLRIYMFREGLVRFASIPYPGDNASLNDTLCHLTNYSLNKNEDCMKSIGEIKWSFEKFKSWLRDGHDNRIWESRIQPQLSDIAIKTLLAIENEVIVECREKCAD